MPILAGQKITAAALGFAQDGTGLTDSTQGTASAFEDWGTETVVFPNPGVPVSVSAMVLGRVAVSVDVLASARVGISLDGGATFAFGPNPEIRVESTANSRDLVAGLTDTSGTPTGTVVVKVQHSSNTAGVTFEAGHLTATVMPT